ncbi:hypothetical protein AAFF_G00289310 [Aldrovandia affinis]|uniref:Uncharacterized protein n=1 Tax=Aldrovandia affinis TaxID=143900 RepID=A0AAD7RC73_9TELE|nr:hypothetical protein AAFF_G00289310 [Aldrovandia affinis]
MRAESWRRSCVGVWIRRSPWRNPALCPAQVSATWRSGVCGAGVRVCVWAGWTWVWELHRCGLGRPSPRIPAACRTAPNTAGSPVHAQVFSAQSTPGWPQTGLVSLGRSGASAPMA